jgi:hypothetical protein
MPDTEPASGQSSEQPQENPTQASRSFLDRKIRINPFAAASAISIGLAAGLEASAGNPAIALVMGFASAIWFVNTVRR